MAKSRSIFNLQGTIEGKTFVQSKTYGSHVRAARGTHAKANVNDAFRESSMRLLNANLPAKIIKDALDPYRTHFKGGQLWQRLVSQFRKQQRVHGVIDFSKLETVEVHEAYRLSRLLYVKAEADVDAQRQVLQVTLRSAMHPRFRKASVDGYRLGVIAIFPDMEQKNADSAAGYSPILGLKDTLGEMVMEFSLPENFRDYVLCVVAEGCERGKVDSSPTTKGMCIMERMMENSESRKHEKH